MQHVPPASFLAVMAGVWLTKMARSGPRKQHTFRITGCASYTYGKSPVGLYHEHAAIRGFPELLDVSFLGPKPSKSDGAAVII